MLILQFAITKDVLGVSAANQVCWFFLELLTLRRLTSFSEIEPPSWESGLAFQTAM